MAKNKNRAAQNKADKLWGELIHKIWPKCPMDSPEEPCKGRAEAHHLISRSCLASRHNPRNGVILCSLHHRFSKKASPHGGPIAFSEFLRLTFPAIYDWVIANKWTIQHSKPDYVERCRVLKTFIAIVDSNPDKVAEIRKGLYGKE